MSNPLYFCHSCNREVRSRDSDLKCSVCGGEFIEEIEQHPTIRFAGDSGGDGGPSGLGPNPMNLFGQLLTGAVGAGPSQRPAPARSARGGPTPTPAEGLGGPQNAGANGQPDPVQNFIQNLLGSLGGLAGPDVHLQINFSGPNGRGEGVQIFSRNLDDYAWGADGLDRIVTNLLNQFDANQPEQGLAPEELERVPVTKVTQKHVDNTTQCTTCMETFKLDESVLELGCRHIFHRDCLIPWLERHRTCPICRQEVDPSGWQANTAAPRPQDHIDQQPSAPSGRDPMNDFDLD